MGLSTTTTIFLFIVCLCGGIIIGSMFWRMKKAPPDQPEEAPKPDSAAKSLARPGETEILHAWQDEQGKIWLEMDGQRLENKEAMEAGQKAKLLEMVLELRPWLEAAPTPAPRPQVQEAPRPTESPPRPSPAAPRPPAAEKKADEKKSQVNLKSIVEQIDDVLQEKLAGTVFASQKIQLLEGRGGEVEVQIGAQKYSGVEVVPDPEVQALIRQAVAEWEKKSG